MISEWRSSYYSKDSYTESARLDERKRRVELNQFVMQRDLPGGSKQFRIFDSVSDAYSYINSQPLEERNFYETVFDVHPRQKPHFDLDIVPSLDDPMDHNELLTRVLTEIKNIIGSELDVVKDLGVYSSHAEDGSKMSYHVVVTGYHVLNNIEACNFASAVRQNMMAATDNPREVSFIDRCFDLSVYKKLQQFRILGCTKLGRNRYKTVVLQYSAAGRPRIRSPVIDSEEEFRRSLLSVVDDDSRYLDPAVYTKPQDKFAAAESLLRELCSRGRDLGLSQISREALWLTTSKDIVTHVIASGHLSEQLVGNCERHNVIAESGLIILRAPPYKGYWCIICDRKHDNENPYLSLREDRTSSAATEMCPRVVAIILHCRRDPLSTIRLCSMRGGGESGMVSFTCIDNPHDPRQGEKFVRAS